MSDFFQDPSPYLKYTRYLLERRSFFDSLKKSSMKRCVYYTVNRSKGIKILRNACRTDSVTLLKLHYHQKHRKKLKIIL